MLDPVAAVDPVAGAQRVERQLRARVFRLGDRQRVDHPELRDRFTTAAFQLGVEEAKIELRVVRDQLRVAQERHQIVRAVREQRFFGQETVGQAVHFLRLFRHRAFGVVVAVKAFPRLDPVHQLDAADLHHPVALGRVEAGRFGIEDNFAHCRLYRTATARWQAGSVRFRGLSGPAVRAARRPSVAPVRACRPTGRRCRSPCRRARVSPRRATAAL